MTRQDISGWRWGEGCFEQFQVLGSEVMIGN